MENYCAKTDIEAYLGFSIDANSRPTTTELTVFIDNADGIINGVCKKSTNMIDTYKLLKPIACKLVLKMVNNVFAFAYPDQYDMVDVDLSPEEERKIKIAHSIWIAGKLEMGVDT